MLANSNVVFGYIFKTKKLQMHKRLKTENEQ